MRTARWIVLALVVAGAGIVACRAWRPYLRTATAGRPDFGPVGMEEVDFVPLQVGDEVPFGSPVVSGHVVTLTDTTDANGRFSIAYDGRTFRGRVIRAGADGGTEFPWVSAADPLWRLGLVKHPDEELYVYVSDGPPAPGEGRWIEQSEWEPPEDLEAQDSVILRLGWRPGPITILKGGVEEEDAYADLVAYPTTLIDGECEAPLQPEYPYGASRKGCYKTDSNGRLWDVRTGTERHIILPKGLGAIGHREGDTWPGMSTPERTLGAMYVRYLQESAVVEEGKETDLDVGSGSITVTCPVGATVVGWWEGSLRRCYTVGPSTGEQTYEGLPPGEYTFECYSSGNVDYLPRQDITLEAGGEITLDFGSSWNQQNDPDLLQVHVYHYGSEPAAGASVWVFRSSVVPPVNEWQEAGQTDAEGNLSVDISTIGITAAAVVDRRGCAVAPSIAGGYFGPCIAGRFGGIRSGEWYWYPANPEGFIPWGPDGKHVNLDVVPPGCCLKDDKGNLYEIGEMVSEPCPLYRIDHPSETPSDVTRYQLIAMDGTVLASNLQLHHDEDPPWASGTPNWWENSAEGWALFEEIGGKVHGALARARTRSLIPEELVEPWRLGLETGIEIAPVEIRVRSESSEVRTPSCFTHSVCPYCRGPVWNEASDGTRVRWQCLEGCGADTRLFFRTPTVAANGVGPGDPTYDGYRLRIVRALTAGGMQQLLVLGWPRPEEYKETNDYLTTIQGLSRWAAVHIVLGTWDGSFTDGESIADVEARLGRTVGPVHLKAITTDYCGSETEIAVTATRSNGQGSEVLTGTIPAGSAIGTIVLLVREPHSRPPPRGRWYTDVTDAGPQAGMPAPPGFSIVNDGPAWHGDYIEVEHQASSPWLCDIPFAGGRPYMTTDAIGRVWMVCERRGQILAWYSEHPDFGWEGPWPVTDAMAWRNPSIAPRSDGHLIVSATDAGGTTRLFESADDGERWNGITA